MLYCKIVPQILWKHTSRESLHTNIGNDNNIIVIELNEISENNSFSFAVQSVTHNFTVTIKSSDGVSVGL